MKRFFLKNKIKLLIYTLILFILIIPVTKAAEGISIAKDGDLVDIRYTGSYYSATSLTFYYNTVDNRGTAMNVLDSKMAVKTSTRARISLMNGTYYFWVFNSLNGATYHGSIYLNTSCTDDRKIGVTGEFTIERCAIVSLSGSKKVVSPSKTNLTANNNFVECAAGYKLEADNGGNPVSSTCSSLNMLSFNRRYCKQVYSGNCVADGTSTPEPPGGGGGSGGGGSGGGGESTVAAPSLKSLSVSSGSLSPSFKSGTKSYKVSVGADVSSISIYAEAASGSSFVAGYGPATYDLKYGTNNISVKVRNSANKTVTYSIVVTRADNRSNVNTLSNLTVDKGTLTPAFASNVNSYTVNVESNVEQITVGATLTDSKSSFSNGYGPNTYTLQDGANQIYVKVASENGVINVYNITVIRGDTSSVCTSDVSSLALLKEIKLSSDKNIQIDQILSFDSKIFTYDDIKVPYEVSDLMVDAYVNEEGDTVVVEGAEELEVGVPREVKITVTSKNCPNFSNVYTLNVTRQEQVVKGSDATLASLTIDGYDDIGFESSKYDYGIKLHKGDTELKIIYTAVDPNTQCVISGNQDLTQGSVISIVCTSEDENDVVTYSISIDGVEKGTNTFLIIIIIILIVIILIYLILRLLGYKIYFNFSVIGAFFRGIGEKINGIFDK